MARDTHYIMGQTLLHEKINWKVNAALAGNKKLVTTSYFKCGVPTRLSNGFGIPAGAVLEEIIIKADSIDPAKMKQAALI